MQKIRLSELRAVYIKRRNVNALLTAIYYGHIEGLNGLHWTVLTAMLREHYGYSDDLCCPSIGTLAKKLKRGTATIKKAIDDLQRVGILGWETVPAGRRNIRPARRYYVLVTGTPKSASEHQKEMIQRLFRMNGHQVSAADWQNINDEHRTLNNWPEHDYDYRPSFDGQLCLNLRRRKVRIPAGYDLKDEKNRVAALVLSRKLRGRDPISVNPWRLGATEAVRQLVCLGRDWASTRYRAPEKLPAGRFVGWYEDEQIPRELAIPDKSHCAITVQNSPSIPTLQSPA